MRKFLILFMVLTILVSIFGCGQTTGRSVDPSADSKEKTIVFVTNLANSGKTVENIFSHSGVWYGGENERGAMWAGLPKGSVVKEFPFLRYDTLHAMTGGSDTLDLYVDKNDPSKGMDFTNFNIELNRVLDQGLIPYIKVATVPQCLSDDMEIGAFGVNKRPPTTQAQWNEYYKYVKAIAQDVVDNFGLSAARTWQWGCFSEADNADWFETSDKNDDTTRDAYFKLYDYTVAALQSVLGENQFNMGTHLLGSMAKTKSKDVPWDELEFIEHCAIGTNYYSQKVGTQLNFIAISHYNAKPGVSTNARSFTEEAERIKAKAGQYGLDMKIGVDEYGTLSGPDDVQLLGSRTIGHSWQTSKTASDYLEFLNFGYDYVSLWALKSSWHEYYQFPSAVMTGARLNQANVAEFTYKLVGSKLQTTSQSGEPLNTRDKVQSIVTYNPEANKTYAFLFNHNENLEAVDSEKVSFTINNIAPLSGKSVTVNKYILDSTHSNWYDAWWNGKGKDAQFVGSKYDVIFPSFLSLPADKEYWNNNVNRYAEMSKILPPEVSALDVTNNSITIETTLTHHSVVLYEITNSKVS